MRKLTSIDYLRAFSMLYIVGYWHLFDYSSVSLGHTHPVPIYVTHTILALFVLVSGFLLGGKSTQSMTPMQFYRKRLLRIYPLYVLAVLAFYAYGMNDGWTSIKALLGISMLLEPAPLTLWFVTMLVLFYMMAPLLLNFVKNIPAFIAVAGAVMVATMAVQFTLATVDPRFLLYFPAFALGIFCANHGISNRIVNGFSALLVFAVGILCAFIEFGIETLNYLKEVLLVVSGAYLVLLTSIKNEEKFKPVAVIGFLSYSSFAIYLFHRPIFSTIIEIYYPTHPVAQVAYLMTIGMVIVAVLSWSLQKLYDTTYEAVRARFQPAGNVAV
jgi:peptidoglycan/LPS O-acetylase OafA/YrhL